MAAVVIAVAIVVTANPATSISIRLIVSRRVGIGRIIVIVAWGIVTTHRTIPAMVMMTAVVADAYARRTNADVNVGTGERGRRQREAGGCQ